jgi:hypothetical protein
MRATSAMAAAAARRAASASPPAATIDSAQGEAIARNGKRCSGMRGC